MKLRFYILVTLQQREIQILWIDSGYNTHATYRFAQELIDSLNLTIDVFTPKVTASRCNAVMGGIPSIEDERHQDFTTEVKLEPFERGMATHKPEVWFTAIRKVQTEFRQSLDIVTQGRDGVLKIAPVFHWTDADMAAYLNQSGLPNEEDYYDPTKVLSRRECGLHTM